MNSKPVAGVSFFKSLSKERVFLLANILLVSVMMVRQSWFNLAAVLLSVVFIWHFKDTRQNRAFLPFLILSGVFFVALLIVHLFTFSRMADGLHLFEKYIPVALMPLLLSRTYEKSIGRREWEWILQAFAVSTTLVALYCFSAGLHKFLFLPPSGGGTNADNYNQLTSSWNYLSYTELSGYVGLHPAYLSIFVSFAIFIFAEKRSPRYRWVLFLAIVFLIGFLFLLSSRMALVAFFIVAAGYAFLRVRQNFRVFSGRYLSLGFLVAAAFALMVFFNTLLQKRLGDLASLRTDIDVRSWNAVNLRVAIWKCNSDIARENLLLGIGFESRIRDACYSRYSFYPQYGTELNAHSQYLEFLVAGGIGLCLLFLIYMGALIRVAIRHREKLFLILLTLLLVNFLTECVISRGNGVLFMMYFSSFFMFLVTATNSPDTVSKK